MTQDSKRWSAIALVLLCGTVQAGWSTSYTFSSFDVPGSDDTWPEAIADDGTVVGTIETASGETGFIRNPNGGVLLFAYPGNGIGAPTDINGRGIIVGFFYDGPTGPFGTPAHGFLRQPDGSLMTFDFPGSVSTYPSGINDKGQIAGTLQDTDGVFHGFLREPDGSFFQIDHPDGIWTRVSGIGPRGEMIGLWQGATSGISHGFLRTRSGKFQLISQDPNTYTDPRAINARGDIVGESGNGPFLRYADGTWVSLKYPVEVGVADIGSVPTGINRDQVVVGAVNLLASRNHGYLAEPVRIQTKGR